MVVRDHCLDRYYYYYYYCCCCFRRASVLGWLVLVLVDPWLFVYLHLNYSCVYCRRQSTAEKNSKSIFEIRSLIKPRERFCYGIVPVVVSVAMAGGRAGLFRTFAVKAMYHIKAGTTTRACVCRINRVGLHRGHHHLN